MAKDCHRQADGSLPPEIAAVLYYLSNATALVRLGVRISAMDGESLRQHMEEVAAESWVDDASRSLLQQAIRVLAPRATDEEGRAN